MYFNVRAAPQFPSAESRRRKADIILWVSGWVKSDSLWESVLKMYLSKRKNMEDHLEIKQKFVLNLSFFCRKESTQPVPAPWPWLLYQQHWHTQTGQRMSSSHYSSSGIGICLGSELSLKAYKPKLPLPILKSYPVLLLPDISQVATMQIGTPPLSAVLV